MAKLKQAAPEIVLPCGCKYVLSKWQICGKADVLLRKTWNNFANKPAYDAHFNDQLGKLNFK
jgi:hypothetical protein